MTKATLKSNIAKTLKDLTSTPFENHVINLFDHRGATGVTLTDLDYVGARNPMTNAFEYLTSEMKARVADCLTLNCKTTPKGNWLAPTGNAVKTLLW